MTYKALYREWRPQRFADVVGQQHVVQTLGNALVEDRVAHAYLFSGPRGTGKTSVAKILAKAVNCREPQAHEPCNACRACRTITDGSSLDVLEMDAASNRGIDDIRELREGVGYAPAENPRKVYIIDEVHMLSKPAFNALLKTLEEPPPHVIFVLATTEPQKVPTTIASRCQRFRFHRLPMDAMVQRLEEVCQAAGIQAPDLQVLRLMARHADGSLRDALGVLDQVLAFEQDTLDRDEVLRVLGKTADEYHLTLSQHLAQGDAAGVFAVIDDLFDSGGDLHQFLLDFLEHLRLLLRIKVVPDAAENLLPDGQRQHFVARAASFSHPQLLQALEQLAQAENAVKWSEQPRILLEVALVELAHRFGGTGETAAVAETPAPSARKTAKPASERKPQETPGKPAEAEPAGAAAPLQIAGLAALQEAWPQVVQQLAQEVPGRQMDTIFAAAEPAHWDRQVLTILFDDPAAKGRAAEAAGRLEAWLRTHMEDGAPQVACLLRDEAADFAPAAAASQTAPAASGRGRGGPSAPSQTPPPASGGSTPAPAGEEAAERDDRDEAAAADDLFLPKQARRPTAAELEAAREHPAIRKLLDEFDGTLVAVIEDPAEEDAS